MIGRRGFSASRAGARGGFVCGHRCSWCSRPLCDKPGDQPVPGWRGLSGDALRASQRTPFHRARQTSHTSSAPARLQASTTISAIHGCARARARPPITTVSSAAEDTVVIGGLALALAHPWIALIVVLACSLAGALLVWLVWRALWKGVRWLARSASPDSPRQPGTG